MFIFRLLACLALTALWLLSVPIGISSVQAARDTEQDPIAALKRMSSPGAALREVTRLLGAAAGDASLLPQLETIRQAQLERLLESDVLVAGNERYEINDLYRAYQYLLTRRDELRSRIVVDRDLPPGRFLVLMAAMGMAHPSTPPGTPTMYAWPEVDLARALRSADPWVVSGALFVARKTDVSLPASAIFERWQSRSDRWDDICTEQALLYLARLPRDAPAVAGPARTGLPGSALVRLEAPNATRTSIHVLAFVQTSRPSLTLDFVVPGGSVLQRLHDATMQVASETDVAGRIRVAPVLELDAGFYSFRSIEGSVGPAGEHAGVYGESIPVLCEAGRFNRITIGLFGGV